MAHIYPPEAADKFVAYADHKNKDGTVTKKDIETYGDGFRMSFKTHGGHTFKVAIDMPQTAKPGSYMFDYYVGVPAAARGRVDRGDREFAQRRIRLEARDSRCNGQPKGQQ